MGGEGGICLPVTFLLRMSRSHFETVETEQPYSDGTLHPTRKVGLFLANQDYPAGLKTVDHNTLRKGDKEAHKYKGILTFQWTIFLKDKMHHRSAINSTFCL